MPKMTQKDRIRKYLDDFGSITWLDAASDIGVARLAARISEMIREGDPIIADMETGKNRYGETTHYARYRRAV